MTGKDKCEMLRDIRITIATLNGIKYTPKPCNHEGPCPGSCPQCDKEAEILMRKLERKEASGAEIKIAAWCINEMENIISDAQFEEETPEYLVTMGLPAPPDDDNIIEESVEIPTVNSMLEIEENKLLYDKGISVEDIPLIQQACKGCYYYDTIRIGSSGKPRCAALSEHFFLNEVTESSCPIKK